MDCGNKTTKDTEPGYDSFLVSCPQLLRNKNLPRKIYLVGLWKNQIAFELDKGYIDKIQWLLFTKSNKLISCYTKEKSYGIPIVQYMLNKSQVTKEPQSFSWYKLMWHRTILQSKMNKNRTKLTKGINWMRIIFKN